MKLKRRWECGECHEIHDDEDRAYQCCQPSVNEVYQCPACHDAFDTEEQALACCPEEHEDLPECQLNIPPDPLPMAEYIAHFNQLNQLVGVKPGSPEVSTTTQSQEG